MTSVFDEFKWRGLVYDHTDGVPDILAKEKISVYNGFDPTAESLHIGNLVPMMGLARLQRFGHTPIVLAGGGTGMVGDPSGRSTERNLLTREVIDANVAAQKVQLAHLLDFEVKSNPAVIVNNADWLGPISMMDFLRDTGKYFTINYMLAKDSVKSRMDRGDGVSSDGISFTEFSYMLLQAYDFRHLFNSSNCVMQAGGSDQWGNIIAGVELIRKSQAQKAYGLVYPLITKADGSKFGKTADGAVWLSPEKTSPYRFYQYWYNADDAEVINFLRYFTWLNKGEIAELEAMLLENPHRRDAQKKLAQVMTQMIHGETAVSKAETASRVLFGGAMDGLDANDIADIFADVPSSDVPRHQFADGGLSIVDLLAESSLANSKGDAKRAIKGGGVYLNNERVSLGQTAVLDQSIDGKFFILRKGKKKYHLIQLK